MDNKTKILVCLNAAVAANCVSCFNHYNAKARAEGVDPEEVKAAVDLGKQVNRGAHIALMRAVEGAASGEAGGCSDGKAADGSSCCR